MIKNIRSEEFRNVKTYPGANTGGRRRLEAPREDVTFRPFLESIRTCGESELGMNSLADETFRDGKALASSAGIIPREYSSGGRQKLGG